MRYSFFSKAVLLVFVLMSGLLTANATAETSNVQISGYSFWQVGQIVQGDNSGSTIDHQWTNTALLGLTVAANPSDRLHLVLSPEFKLNYPFPEDVNHPETVRPFGLAYINQANGVFSIGGDPEKPALELGLGVFTYKYNPNSRHLGEFLFRTGTYPMYILTDFDFAAARLIGLKLTTDAITNLHADLLLTSEAFLYPLYDFSLTAIADYKILNAIDVGLGVDFARLFSVSSSKTTPHFTKINKPAGYNEYVKKNGDTSFYSFQGTKLMARASIDPKVFFGSPAIFGKEDLKIYGEIMCEDLFGGYKAKDSKDSLGHDSTGYPAIYNDLSRRMPIMLGFNVPTFTGLDVFSVEVEYFPSMLPNEYGTVVNQLSPMPSITGGIGAYNPNDYKNGAWRWSVYAKRTILNGFSITGLGAFDHLRTTYWNGATQFFSCMTKPGNWHWELKFGYSF